MKISDVVQLYVRLRDRKAERAAEHRAEIAEFDEKLEKIELKLMEAFAKLGVDSVKTEFGTAYTSIRTTASVADRQAFMDFVVSKQEWPLLEVRVAKSAVDQYREAHDNEIPPGVSIREERVVGIRRS